MRDGSLSIGTLLPPAIIDRTSLKQGLPRSLRAFPPRERRTACRRARAGRLGPGGTVADPTFAREGNIRFAGISSPGYPDDPWALEREVVRLLAGQEVEAYGPATLIFNVAPSDLPASGWECQVGTTITGLGRSMGRMSVEDYRGLHAWTIAHSGPIKDLTSTWRRLADHATGKGQRLRPYWRLALRDRRLADGNLLPSADVSVFIDT